MLRIILTILEALFGIEVESEAPPTRRQPRRAGGRANRKDEGAPTSLEDMFKRLLGIEGEPQQQPARAAQAARSQQQPQQARERRALPAARTALAVPDERGEPAELTGTLARAQTAAPRREALAAAARQPQREAEAVASKRAAASNPARTLVKRLRANPAAAAEAFVYAEIFGPPMADRRPGEGKS